MIEDGAHFLAETLQRIQYPASGKRERMQ